MKCKRCGHTMDEPKDGWAKCPKCGLSRPVSAAPEVKKGEEEEEVKAPAESEAPKPEEEVKESEEKAD